MTSKLEHLRRRWPPRYTTLQVDKLLCAVGLVSSPTDSKFMSAHATLTVNLSATKPCCRLTNKAENNSAKLEASTAISWDSLSRKRRTNGAFPIKCLVKQAVREPASMHPRPCKLTFNLLTLKVVSESRVTWPTSVPILVFLGLSVLDWDPMYATDRQTSYVRQTDVRRASSLNAPYPRGGSIIITSAKEVMFSSTLVTE